MTCINWGISQVINSHVPRACEVEVWAPSGFGKGPNQRLDSFIFNIMDISLLRLAWVGQQRRGFYPNPWCWAVLGPESGSKLALSLSPRLCVCRQDEWTRKEPALVFVCNIWAAHTDPHWLSNWIRHAPSSGLFQSLRLLPGYDSAPTAPACLITKQWSGKLEELSVRRDYSYLGRISFHSLFWSSRPADPPNCQPAKLRSITNSDI